jgi:transposase
VQAVFAFDSGVNSKINLAAIEAEKLQYVTRLSKAQLGSLLKKLPEDRQPELFDCTELIDVVQGGVRYVIAGGEMRRHRDRDRREARLAQAESALARLAAVPRKRADGTSAVDPQKLASQAGRLLQRLKAHKYFDYYVDEDGTLQWGRKEEVITEEARLDGWYLLQTNLAPQESANGDGASPEEVLSHYKQLMEVELAFRELKGYLEVRPVYHHRVDRVRNHIRLCFIAYWISARLASEWKAKGETRRVVDILRALQKIRIGSLRLDGKAVARLLTQVPPSLNQTLTRLDLLKLFSKPPAWANL